MTSGKTRLVILIGQLGLGGSERQLYLLLKHLDKDRFDCHVIVFNPSMYVVLNEALERAGVKVLPMPADCRGVWRRMYFLYRTLRDLSPDIVHSWTVHDNPYAGIIGLLARVPVRLGSLRGSLLLRGFRGLPAPVRWLSLHAVSRLVVNSSAIVDELVQSGYPRARVDLLRNCVEIEAEPSRGADLSSLGIQEHHRVVATVGNIRGVKNHLMFVDAMARVLPRFPDVRALIVGQPLPSEPDLPGKIEARIKELDLDGRVALTGFRSDVQTLMRRLSVFCLTSRSEGMPNVVLEAMAAARPVVATRVGGVVEQIENGTNGWLVGSGDVEDFAGAVARLLENPSLAERMGNAGLLRAQRNFGCQEMSSLLGDLYCKAVSSLRRN